MFRTWKFIFLSMMSVFLLVGCTASLEDASIAGVKAAKEKFLSEPKNRTAEIEGLELYKPTGFKVNDKSDAQNIVFNRNNETFILFVNPNESDDSRLFYELLVDDISKEIIQMEVIDENGVFGFVAVVKNDADKEKVELIASIGGVKMTTIAQKSKIEDNLVRMVEVVRSIKQRSE
ncbi:hypothetical protein [Sporosarcina sp. G11-34]|uniref:hypothetical protein n=1 Tax=Sporosarcina sp. G11-34 TaxID=2849605 RepID=UPI0022A9E3B2|nr:hypothetical protein [Sporosarcina sp. G11-34]MCZ2257946.1 hypothetical protein [Sporosarcina sp. G11-34]